MDALQLRADLEKTSAAARSTSDDSQLYKDKLAHTEDVQMQLSFEIKQLNEQNAQLSSSNVYLSSQVVSLSRTRLSRTRTRCHGHVRDDVCVDGYERIKVAQRKKGG